MRVLAAQAAYSEVAEQILSDEQTAMQADVLVIAPMSVQWKQGNKKVADQYGLKLVAYEAGQHLVGVAGAENNE